MMKSTYNKYYNIFSTYHPIVNLTYFIMVIAFTLLMFSPVNIAISFICASAYYVFLKGIKAYLKTLSYMFLIFIVIAGFNPLFNHMGLTVMFYLFGNPITFEALCYGLCSGGMLVSVMLWFSCYSEIMTSDKFIYIFGKFVPTTAMTFSMILRYIPMTIERAKQIQTAQMVLTPAKTESKKAKFKRSIKMTSILMEWSMEESIETANSMRSRGYGLKGRSRAYKYTFNIYDIIILFLMLTMCIILALFLLFDFNKFVFYPYITCKNTSIFFYILLGLLYLLPLLIEVRELFKWKPSNL